MIVYLDSSVIVALLTNDVFTDRAKAFLRNSAPALIVSDYAAAEYASVIARLVRSGVLTIPEARTAFSALDLWAARATKRVETVAADIAAAAGSIRRLDLTLRAPDAVNIAIAQRAGAVLATFDIRMAEGAAALGVAVAAA